MTRFFAVCVTQDAVGCVVAPRIRIRRLACSMTASTYSRAPDSVTVSRKSHASRASAVFAELTLQHGDLVAQGKDLRVLVPVAHRQQAQHHQRVRDGRVRQS
jgi:hypothetical protein